MPRDKFGKEVDEVQEAKRRNRCEEGFWCALPDCERYVCRPRKYVEHIQIYHHAERRWWCSECAKYFQKHSCWSKHMLHWHSQEEFVPTTYVTEHFDVARGDRCEAVFNVKIERKLKRKVEAEQSGQPMKKKRKTTKAAKAPSSDSDATKNIIESILYDLITDIQSSDNLKMLDIPFTGIIVNGEAFSGDVNDNADTDGCQTIELVITELPAVDIEIVEETKMSPKKQYQRRWEKECVDAVEVLEAGFDIELSDQLVKREFDSMVVRLEALTGQLEDAKAKNMELEATVSTLSADLEDSEFAVYRG